MIVPVTTPSLFASSWTQRLWAGAAGLALSALSGLSAGCTFQVPGIGGTDASAVDAVAEDSIENRDSLGSIDLAVLGESPVPVLPGNNQLLPPTRAYLYWKNGPIPMGLSVSDYQVCSTSGAVALIDGSNECPNPATPAKSRHVIEPLSASANYFYKVRARYNDGTFSEYSPVRSFMTDKSLLAWWRLDEGMGTAAADASGVGNGGTLNGNPAWIPGLSGRSLQFSGANYVVVGDRAPLEGMGQLTVETWLKTTTIDSTRHIVSKWNSMSRSYALRTNSGGTGLVTFQTYTAGPVVIDSLAPVNDGLWHYVVGTYDGAAQKLYVDLNLQTSAAQAGTIADSQADVCLAEACNGGAGTGFGFTGNVDETAVYNRALSPEERANGFCAAQTAGGIDPLPASCTP